MNISIIVAVSENGVIGKDNRLLWHLSGDLKRFKALTTGHTIVMGRNTFLSIGKALPNRRNVVLSHSMKTGDVENVEVFDSVETFVQSIQQDDEVFVIGGGQIYRQFLPLASKVYLTRVHVTMDGDTTFPELSSSEWQEIAMEKMSSDEKNDYDYDFIDYYRKKN
ncbi:MAG: dihydrofolate reductase [Paludibacteraceae bacterium]|nr:dihydrofolate reductase [Paludibacteraceae bacterium]